MFGMNEQSLLIYSAIAHQPPAHKKKKEEKRRRGNSSYQIGSFNI
jgi:hypothetical protein